MNFHIQDIVRKIRIVTHRRRVYVYHQATQFFPDLFKLINPGIFQIICMQNHTDQLRLPLNCRYVGNIRQGSHVFHEILPGSCILLPGKISQFYSVHQRVKADAACRVRIRQNQRNKRILDGQCVFIRQGLIPFRFRIKIYILDMLPDRKVFPI